MNARTQKYAAPDPNWRGVEDHAVEVQKRVVTYVDVVSVVTSEWRVDGDGVPCAYKFAD
jgi:hypothetical protein